MFFAAEYGKHDILKALLEERADPSVVGSPIRRLDTPARKLECALDVAIQHKQKACISPLLEQPNALRRYAEIGYWSLREIAAVEAPQGREWEYRKQLFELLFTLGPDTHETWPGYTFPITAMAAEPPALDFLIDRGADSEGRDEELGTALQSAVARGRRDNIARLIQRGAIVDPLSEDWAAFLDPEVDAVAKVLLSNTIGDQRPSRVRHFQWIFGQRY